LDAEKKTEKSATFTDRRARSMLHHATNAFCKRQLKKVGAMNYDSSFKVAAVTTMIGNLFLLGLIPTIFSWARYPCGGTLTGFYQADTGFSMGGTPDECYWHVFDVVTPTDKGTTHTSRAFVQNTFDVEGRPDMDPDPRLVEVIVEPKEACFRCPEFTISCADDYAFDQCWSQHKWTSDGPLSTTLKPIDESLSFATLIEVYEYMHSSGLLSMCWHDDLTTGVCHPANVSSSELSVGGGVQAWVPLELTVSDFNATLHALFPASNPPAAIRMSFWLTGKSPLRGNERQPRPQMQVQQWEFDFDDWMRGKQDSTADQLTVNFYTRTSIVTEMVWRLFPIVILALPVASILLSIIVQSSFGRWSAKGKLLLVTPKSPMFTPSVLVVAAASFGCFAGVGAICLIYPIFFFSQVLGASLGLAVGVDDLLVVYSYLQGLILKPPVDEAGMREKYIEGFADAALTTTFTTLTTMICFACSTYTVFPVQIEIGVACMLCVFFCWVFSVFWFSPILAMLLRRRQAAAANGQATSAAAQTDPMEAGSMALAEPLFRKKLFACLEMPANVGCILAISLELVVLVIGAWSLATIKQEAGFEPLADKFESAYLNWQYAHYRHFDDGFNANMTMVLQSPTVDYSSATTQARIEAATADVGASKFIDGGSVDSWLQHYLAACAANATFACTGSGFYAGVDAWLATDDGRRFTMDVAWADTARTSIKASRVRFMEAAVNFARDAVEAYAVSQAVTEPYREDLGLNLLNHRYMPYELDEIARVSWLLSLAMSAVGLIIALLLIFPPAVAVLTTVSIFAIQLMMMCFFNMVGLLIGPMMIFNVSCAFGIASDSMVHVLHLWTTLREKAAPLPDGYNSYIQLVMAQLGTPILFASLSTMGMFACFGPLAGAFAHIMMCHQLVLLFVIFVAVCLYHSVVFTPAVLLLYEKCFPIGKTSKGSMSSITSMTSATAAA
jgi:hypothetical protein